MTCSECVPASLTALCRRAGTGWVRLLCGSVLLTSTAITLANPVPIETEFADDAILLELPEIPSDRSAPASASTLADHIQSLLQEARANGDPRFLGYAMKQLENWPESAMNSRLLVLRATLSQSLHQFDKARADLLRVRQGKPSAVDFRQATLTLANMELVQGNYPAARQACHELQQQYHDLIAENCLAQVLARTGQASLAYQRLSLMLQRMPEIDMGTRSWTQGSLGEIAAQLGKDVAIEHWYQALRLDPDDLYSRTMAADWLIHHHRYENALELTADYANVDPLAVLRAIALSRLGLTLEAEALIQRLKQRFEEARWRGNLLHRRDYARFLLDLEQQPRLALEQAQLNWQDQREPADTLILLRAAQSARANNAAEAVYTWLRQVGQTDVRLSPISPGDS